MVLQGISHLEEPTCATCEASCRTVILVLRKKVILRNLELAVFSKRYCAKHFGAGGMRGKAKPWRTICETGGATLFIS